MKRLYTVVSTTKTAAGYEIALDGRPVKTPYKSALATPQEALANAIVQEWVAQGDTILPDTMPLTQILSTKIDRVSTERAAMSEGALKYLNTDLLCYRAEADPPEMAAAQAQSWDPILTWFAEKFGHPLKTTSGLVALEHPPEVHEAVRLYTEALDADHFTILQLVTATAGSLVLAMAFVEGQISAQDVFTCTRVEESLKAAVYNEEKYGADPAQEQKDSAMLVDLKASEQYLKFVTA